MVTGINLTCPAGCDAELQQMGRWAPYLTCPACGTGTTRTVEQPMYWGQQVEPSAAQLAFWGGRQRQWEATVGRSVAPGRIIASLFLIEDPADHITLEHVPRPVDLLAELYQLLRAGGRILVSSPNFTSMKLRWPLLHRDSSRFNEVIRPAEHRSQVTEKGIRLALQRAGFDRVTLLHAPTSRPRRHADRAIDLAVRLAPGLRQGLFATGLSPLAAGPA